MTTNGTAAPPEIYPWTDEPWHVAQRERWQAMVDDGWVFGPPLPRRDYVGMEMVLRVENGWPVESHSFWISKENKLPEAIHAEVLARCEQAANARASSVPAHSEDAADHLRDLIIHMYIHEGYKRCGYRKMTTPQKQLFDSIIEHMNDEDAIPTERN